MTALPPPLRRLLSSPDEKIDDAWSSFLEAYSDLILFAIRKSESDPDAVGDAYAFALEQIRKDDFRRLRAFDADGNARFTTWLVVVVRRLTIDLKRRRNGRSTNPGRTNGTDLRKHLRDLESAIVDLTRIPDRKAQDPAQTVESRERMEALRTAVAGLPARDRLLLALRFEDGKSARIIAETMSFDSQFHVYRRLRAVLRELRIELESSGIRSPRG